MTDTTKTVLDDKHNFHTASKGTDAYVQGKAGNDTINGYDGNDTLEGNKGDDKLNGGSGDDLLFGGVGNDRLTGSTGADTFSMRITKGGDNQITDFKVGEDTLQLVLDRKHFLLANELTKNERQETKVDNKLDAKVDKLDNKYFGEELDLVEGEGKGLKNAEKFVDTAVEKKLNITVEGDHLVLTFFEDVGKGNAGTKITLKDLAKDAAIKSVLGDSTTVTAAQQDLIMMMLTDPSVITGTADDDVLVGTDGDDTFIGGIGNDKFVGGEGVDTAVFSGSVLDYRLTSNFVQDYVQGRDGKDQITGIEQATFDEGTFAIVRGHNAGDNLKAEEGVDSLLIGEHGNDTLTGNTGDDVLFGDNDADNNYKNGDDTLDGGAGSDMLIAGGGDDLIYGDSKAPAHLAVNAESDYIDGGQDIDTLKYNETYLNADALHVSVDSDSSNTFVVDAVQNGEINATDVVKNVEVLQATRGDDVIDFTGLSHGMKVVSMAGNDTLTGSDGNDEFHTGVGDDIIIGSKGDDIIDGGGDDDTLVYGSVDANVSISVAVHGAAYKQEYAVTVTGADYEYMDVVKNIESIELNGADKVDFDSFLV